VTWQTRAACAGDPTPSDWDDEVYSDIAGAKKVCSRCPVKADCLAFALGYDAHGIWGGTTTAERGWVRLQRKGWCGKGHDLSLPGAAVLVRHGARSYRRCLACAEAKRRA
jgi:WhiB family redox-sensing transcriptional regulator